MIILTYQLLAAKVHFWYGTTAFAASEGLRIPATALNDPSFVTADHIRMFYQN